MCLEGRGDDIATLTVHGTRMGSWVVTSTVNRCSLGYPGSVPKEEAGNLAGRIHAVGQKGRPKKDKPTYAVLWLSG